MLEPVDQDKSGDDSEDEKEPDDGDGRTDGHHGEKHRSVQHTQWRRNLWIAVRASRLYLSNARPERAGRASNIDWP
jgi:hypothetical protein